jgi:hypothetical protein
MASRVALAAAVVAGTIPRSVAQRYPEQCLQVSSTLATLVELAWKAQVTAVVVAAARDQPAPPPPQASPAPVVRGARGL